MTDHISKERRSANMRAVGPRNTKPEMTVRRLAHKMGYRFRLHRSDLPGKPDLAFPKRRAVIFVHGCFWHGHDCKRGAPKPQANAEFWAAKLSRNVERDREQLLKLEEAGWRALVVWECQLKPEADLRARLTEFLS
jgi:DNA mismatch endonuclease (patch repair protein)